jgi:ligand-binding sensor domain-containing protein
MKKTYYLISIFLVFSLSAYCQYKQGNNAGVPIGPGNSVAPNIVYQSFGEAFQARDFRLLTVGNDNVKWFQTELGIVSFDGQTWKMQEKNRKVPSENIKDISYDFSAYGHELWIASPSGATVASIPIDAKSGATTYYKDNSKILSENVLAVVAGKGSIRWFGTDKGISAFRKNDWLPVSYQRKYPEGLFLDFPITTMATSPDGDSLYAATEGGGVSRFYRNDVDAITGASEYAAWGPIEMPSDNVYSICLAAGGKIQWFGTDKGVARHIGYKTLENWTVFTTNNGLIDNFVQSIETDRNGNVWFGTKGGVSVFDGTSWKSFTQKDGLPGNNIRCMKLDKEGMLWMGTDQGVISYYEGKFTCYK